MNLFLLILVLFGGGLFLYSLEKIDSFNSEQNFIDFSGLSKKLDDLENDLKNCKTGLDVLKVRERCWEIRKEYSGYLSFFDSDRIHVVVIECNEILYTPGRLKRNEEQELKIKREEKNERIRNS